MSIEVTDYIDVEQRAAALGVKAPEGFCILPRGFEQAKEVSELFHESTAVDLRTLFRQAEIPVTIYQPDGRQIPYIQENDNRWIGPMLFFGAAVMSEHPHIVNVALGVIANYVTEFFKGSPEPARAKLSVVVETHTTKTTTTTTKKFDFDGPPDKITEIAALIKDVK